MIVGDSLLLVLPPEIYVQPPVPEAGAGVAVPAAPHADLQLVPPREVDRHGHVLRGRRAHDHRGPRHARAVVDCPQLVVPADDGVNDDDDDHDDGVNDDEGDDDLGPQQGTTSPMTRSCSRDSGALCWWPVSGVARLQPSAATRAMRRSMAGVSGSVEVWAWCDLAAVSSYHPRAELRHCSITAASLQHHHTAPSHRPLITLYSEVWVRSWVGCRCMPPSGNGIRPYP